MIIRLLLLLILNILLFNNVFSQEKQKIIFASRENYPYTSSNPFDSGYFIDLTKKALEYSGTETEYIFVSNDQAMKLMKEGQVDAIIGVSGTENGSLVMSNSAYLETTTGVYALEDYVGTVSEIRHLYNKIVGLTVDLPLESNIKNLLYGRYMSHPKMFRISDGFNSIEENIELLLDKDIDVYLEDEYVMNNYIQDNDPPIKKIGSLNTFKIYVAFSTKNPKSQENIKSLDAGIMTMRNSGELKEIENKYFNNTDNNAE